MKFIPKFLILVGGVVSSTHFYRAHQRQKALAQACLYVSNSGNSWTGWQMQARVDHRHGGFNPQVAYDEWTASFLNRMLAKKRAVMISCEPTAAHPLTSRWDLTTKGRYACQRMAYGRMRWHR